MSSRTGRASNYAYGRGQEAKCGREIKAQYGGHFKRSKGSRGAADVINYLPDKNRTVIMTQVKSSRANSSNRPTATKAEYARLRASAQNYALKSGRPVIPVMEFRKGGKSVGTYQLGYY